MWDEEGLRWAIVAAAFLLTLYVFRNTRHKMALDEDRKARNRELEFIGNARAVKLRTRCRRSGLVIFYIVILSIVFTVAALATGLCIERGSNGNQFTGALVVSCILLYTLMGTLFLSLPYSLIFQRDHLIVYMEDTVYNPRLIPWEEIGSVEWDEGSFTIKKVGAGEPDIIIPYAVVAASPKKIRGLFARYRYVGGSSKR